MCLSVCSWCPEKYLQLSTTQPPFKPVFMCIYVLCLALLTHSTPILLFSQFCLRWSLFKCFCLLHVYFCAAVYTVEVHQGDRKETETEKEKKDKKRIDVSLVIKLIPTCFETSSSCISGCTVVRQIILSWLTVTCSNVGADRSMGFHHFQ